MAKRRKCKNGCFQTQREQPMYTKSTVSEIQRLKRMGLSQRRTAAELKINRETGVCQGSFPQVLPSQLIRSFRN